jgi:signal transduction histidine kinase
VGGVNERIAEQLHDGALQELTLARLQLDLLSASVAGSPLLAERLREASDALGDVTKRLQEIVGLVQTSS